MKCWSSQVQPESETPVAQLTGWNATHPISQGTDWHNLPLNLAKQRQYVLHFQTESALAARKSLNLLGWYR
jgi:hypothetical protein